MSDTEQATGACLCGAVRISAANMKTGVGACHCDMCRKWGGGPLVGVECGQDVSFDGEEHIKVFDSSDWAARGFCSSCGSHLFYKLKPTGEYIVPVGLFGDGHSFVLEHQVFIDEKPGYYSFAEKTTDMTGPEIFAKYAPGGDTE